RYRVGSTGGYIYICEEEEEKEKEENKDMPKDEKSLLRSLISMKIIKSLIVVTCLILVHFIFLGAKSLVSLFLLLRSKESKFEDLFRSELYEIKQDGKVYFYVAIVGDKVYFYNLGELLP